jgi:AcrR family transcriptional regulator
MPENRISDIIQAAVDVFSRRGYRLAQMEEIAREAEVSKATLYYYFRNKIHLFRYVLEHGVPDRDAVLPPPDASLPKSEEALLRLLKRQLRERTQLPGVEARLAATPSEVDIESELREVLEEVWDLLEQHRVQIVILEKSAEEFPELARIYDTYARRKLVKQLQDYLATRIEQGMIRPLHSVEVAARFITEGMSWFGWKQRSGRTDTPYSRSEVLPDFASTLARGLRP